VVFFQPMKFYNGVPEVLHTFTTFRDDRRLYLGKDVLDGISIP